MPFHLEQIYRDQFNAGILSVVQQTESPLLTSLSEVNQSQSSETEYFDEIEPMSLSRKTSHGAPTPLNEATYYRRASNLFTWNSGVAIKDAEQANKIASDPTSAITRELGHAELRCEELSAINVMTGTAFRKDETRKTFVGVDIPASQQIAVNYVPTGAPADSGLTLAKLKKAKSLFGKTSARLNGPLYFALSQAQEDDLLNIIETTSKDFNTVPVLVDGSISRFMGFHFVKTEQLPVVNGVRTCVAYSPSAFVITTGQRKADIAERIDKSYMLQAYIEAAFGGVRRQEKLTALVYAAEA
jgi:hypothetical protein